MLVRLLLCCVVLVSWVMFFWLCESRLKGTPREIWYRDESPRQKWPTASVLQSFNGNTGPIHLARHSQEVQMNKRANKQPLSRLWAALTTGSWNFPIISWPPKRSVEERIAMTYIPPFPRDPPCCFGCRWEIPSNYSAFIYFALPNPLLHETCWPPSYSLTLNKFCEIVWRNFEKVVSGAPKLLNTFVTTFSGMDRVWSAVFALSTPSCAPNT